MCLKNTLKTINTRNKKNATDGNEKLLIEKILKVLIHIQVIT